MDSPHRSATVASPGRDDSPRQKHLPELLGPGSRCAPGFVILFEDEILPRVIPSRASPVPDIARLSPDARSPLMELSYSPAYSHQGGIALLV